MKLIKGVVIVLAGIFLFITLISLLIPNKIITAKALTVQGDSSKIFMQISMLKNWNNWHPAFKNDTNLLKIKSDNEATWAQNKTTYTMKVVQHIYPTIKIIFEQEAQKNIENIFTIQPVQEQGNFQIQWQSITHLRWYPWEKFSGIFIEKMAGAGNEEALQSLKNFIEKK